MAKGNCPECNTTVTRFLTESQLSTRVLILHGKHADVAFDATGSRIDQAFLEAFLYQDLVMGYYVDAEEVEALQAARSGDIKAARHILDLRDRYEYETWDLMTTVTEQEVQDWKEKYAENNRS